MNDDTNQAIGTERDEKAGVGNAAGTGAEPDKSAGIAGTEPTDKKDGKEEKVTAMTPDEIDSRIQAAISKYAKQQEKARTEAEKLSGMNEQERIAYERDSYKSQLDELNQKIARSEMQSAARTMLSEKGLHVPDGIVEHLVTDDAETTKQNVESFSQLFSDAVEAAVKARLKSETPTRGVPATKITKEQIMAIKDDSKRIQAIRDNMDLFQ